MTLDVEWVSSDIAWLLADDLVLSLDNAWNKSQLAGPRAAASPGEVSLPAPPIVLLVKGCIPPSAEKGIPDHVAPTRHSQGPIQLLG